MYHRYNTEIKMVTPKQLANLKKEPGITKENAREMQLKGARKRKENRTMREILLQKLKEPGRKDNILEKLVAKAESGDLAAFDRVKDLAQENDGTVKEQNVLELKVSNETADILKRIGQ